MKNNDFNQKGGAKKFLYTGVKKDVDDQEDLPWNFGSKNNFQKKPTENSKFEMDDVWSIKRNVNAKGGIKDTSPDPLTFSTNKSYYSRYTGNATNGAEEKPSNLLAQPQRPSSFSYGNATVTTDQTSPRHVSVSSVGTYSQSNTNSFVSRYSTSQAPDKLSSNNNAVYNRGMSQNGGKMHSPVSTYQNGGSLSSREGNMMMSTGARNTMKGRFNATKETDTTNRSRFHMDTQSNQQDKEFW